MSEPSYISLHRSGLLGERACRAREMLASCRLCPRQCGVDRTAGETGVCRTGARARVASYGPHFGEERPLVGKNGSGAIFFSHCNLYCVFCQNEEISHGGEGRDAKPEELAALMIDLARRGCHNINFVTPSHVAPMILDALPLAVEAGLNVPLVWNSGGYDSVQTLGLLEGVIDIYMPDFKFWSAEPGKKYCDAPDYPEIARTAIVEMHRQVGDLEMDDEGLAGRGLLVRHLVMPGRVDETGNIARFLVEKVSPRTYINIMGQYRPCGRAHDYDELAAPLASDELEKAKNAARDAGLTRLDEPRRNLFALR